VITTSSKVKASFVEEGIKISKNGNRNFSVSVGTANGLLFLNYIQIVSLNVIHDKNCQCNIHECRLYSLENV
jgi:hypothetical protein